jgi:serine/threonine protein kinase
MLTTEKLFRGDTEFALMEKVRKAEVPPPSNFNRRVTPELDAISLKALARDVADRYQTAAQLAADLDALIAGYRFDPKELRQFIRQLFRKEYAKELEDTQLSLEAEPGAISMSNPMGAIVGSARVAMTAPTMGSAGHPSNPALAASGSPVGLPVAPPVPPPPPRVDDPGARPTPTSTAADGTPATHDGPEGHGEPGTDVDPDGDKPKGFWGSLFKKRK